MSSIQRLNVLALYRAKLHICREMGHNYGSWNRIYVYKTQRLVRRFKSKSIIDQKNIGTIMWNNVQNQYKLHADETDTERIDEMIDDGFNWLSHMNYVLGEYKYTHYYRWGYYEPLQIESGKF